MTVTLTGQDSITINNRVITNLGAEDVGQLTYPNEISSTTKAHNGNTLIANNEEGKISELELRVILGSEDDKFLNSLLTNWNNDPLSFILLNCVFSKRTSAGDGVVNNKKYNLTDGVFSKRVEVKYNVSGDTEQAESMYFMRFGDSTITNI